jgi:hypothetical protein
MREWAPGLSVEQAKPAILCPQVVASLQAAAEPLTDSVLATADFLSAL